MMMTSIPGYSLPALPASNYNYGARPATTANPEYGSGSAWKTAVTTPISNTATQNTQYNNDLKQNLNQYDGRSYSPTYSPTYTDNSRYAYNPTANTSIDNSRYTYNPQTATQNTQYNNEINQKLQQYLNQNLTNNTANVAVDNSQLNQAQYTQNTANTANIDYNNLLAYYNPVTNSYNFPPVPQQPSYPPVTNYPPATPTPEKPPEKKGSFPWLPVGLGVAGLAAFLIFGNKKHKPPTETPPTETPPTETPPTETHPKTPKTPKTPDTPEPHVPETPHKLNRYHIYGDPYITVNGGSVIEHKAGIKKRGGTATVPLGKTDAGTNVSATYVRSLVDGKHGSMESIKKLKIDFPDGKAIAIDTGKAGTFAYIGDEKISLEKNGKYESGNQTISIENGRVTITSEDSSEVFTVKLGKYNSPKNQKNLGKYFLEVDAQVGDFVNGVFDDSEVKSTGSRINS